MVNIVKIVNMFMNVKAFKDGFESSVLLSVDNTLLKTKIQSASQNNNIVKSLCPEMA